MAALIGSRPVWSRQPCPKVRREGRDDVRVNNGHFSVGAITFALQESFYAVRIVEREASTVTMCDRGGSERTGLHVERVGVRQGESA